MNYQVSGHVIPQCEVDSHTVCLGYNYSAEIEALCGYYSRQLSQIFIGDACAALVLAEHKRRLIWRAHVAGPQFQAPKIPQETTAYIQWMLTASNETLLSSSYGSCPAGFVSLIGAQQKAATLSPGGLRILHRLLDSGVCDARNLANFELSDSFLNVLHELPPEFATPQIAQCFPDKVILGMFREQVAFFERLLGKSLETYVFGRLKARWSVDRVINALYDELAFPPPVLTADDDLTYLNTVEKLKSAGATMENCLATEVEHALNASTQYYTLYTEEHGELAFSIERLVGEHWAIGEVQTGEMMFCDPADFPKLIEILEAHNIILNNGNIPRQIENFMNNYRRRRQSEGRDRRPRHARPRAA